MQTKVGTILGWTMLTSALTACSSGSEATDGSEVRAGGAEAEAAPPRPAREVLKHLRKKYVLTSPDPLSPSGKDLQTQPVIGSGKGRYLREGGRLLADVLVANKRRVHLDMPEVAKDAFRLRDEQSGMRLAVRLKDAVGSKAEVVDDAIVYRSALKARFDVVQRISESGTEDFIHVTTPDTANLAYQVTLEEKVAGVRVVANTVEFLDEHGEPTLRMAPPYLVDAAGTVKWADVSVSGCAYDPNPLPPTSRPRVSPGSDSCHIDVSWNAEDVKYPVLVDPPWGSTGSMAVARYGHTQSYWEYVYEQPGNVLKYKLIVAGGMLGNSYLNSCERYDGTSWVAVDSMATARAWHSGISRRVTSSAPGQYVVGGGLNGGASSLNSAERYDFGTGLWTPTANTMRAPRAEFEMASVDTDQALAAGGRDGLAPLNTAEVYNFATNRWSSIPSFTSARYGHRVTALRTPWSVVGGKNDVLVSGGYDGLLTIASTQRYSPTANVWYAVGNLNPAVAWHTATQVTDGPTCANCATEKVFVIGGVDTNFTRRRSIQRFDPITNTWNNSYASLPMGVAWHCASLIQSEIWGFFYGQTILYSGGQNENYQADATWRTYNPPTFTGSGTGVVGRLYAACGPSAPFKVLTTGGQNNQGSAVAVAELWQ